MLWFKFSEIGSAAVLPARGSLAPEPGVPREGAAAELSHECEVQVNSTACASQAAP